MALERLLARISSYRRFLHPYPIPNKSAEEVERRTKTMVEVVSEARNKLDAAIQSGQSITLLAAPIIRDEGGVRILLEDGSMFLEDMINTAIHSEIMNNYNSENIPGLDVVSPVIPQEFTVLRLNQKAKIPLRMIESLFVIYNSQEEELMFVSRERYIRSDDRTPVALRWVAYPPEHSDEADRTLAYIKAGAVLSKAA